MVDATEGLMLPDAEWRRYLQRRVVFGLSRRYAPRQGRSSYLLTELATWIRGRVLDVGAGSTAGVLSAAIGAGYEALDIGDSYKLSEDADRTILRHVADIDGKRLPFDDRSFDTVLCLDVLEHIDDIHFLFDELFRVASSRVIVSLPNNWPGIIWSLLIARNVTHAAGYGIGPEPKLPGQRHKHFFNLEEACQFAVGRKHESFVVRRMSFVFEHGSDGVLASWPPLSRFFRLVGKATLTDARDRYGRWGLIAWVTGKAIYVPLRVIDVALSALVYGWGDAVRFYNAWCRQIWIVYERSV